MGWGLEFCVVETRVFQEMWGTDFGEVGGEKSRGRARLGLTPLTAKPLGSGGSD